MTALTVIYIVFAAILLIAALIAIGVLVYIYLEDRDSNDTETNAARVKDVLLSLLGPIVAVLWPLTFVVGLVYGGYRLIKTMRKDLKANKQNQTIANN